MNLKDKPLPDSLETIEQMLVGISGSLINSSPANSLEQILAEYEKNLEFLQFEEAKKSNESRSS